MGQNVTGMVPLICPLLNAAPAATANRIRTLLALYFSSRSISTARVFFEQTIQQRWISTPRNVQDIFDSVIDIRFVLEEHGCAPHLCC